MSDTNHEHDEKCASYHVHMVPLWALALILGILLALTTLTVVASMLEIGELALIAAMAIAVVKATLVMLFFMHLWWDSKFNALAAAMSLAFVALFIGFSVLDTNEYRENVLEYRSIRGAPRIEVKAPTGDDHDHEGESHKSGAKDAAPGA